MRTHSCLVLVAGVLVVTGCRGKIVATAELHGAGSADVQFQSTGAPVILWADTDGSWTGGTGNNSHFPVHYEIDVFSKGANIGHVACDTKETSESVCGVKTSNGSSHSGDCELKLTCVLPAIPIGAASLHVVGTPGKQASDIKKMSINLRDK
jgi:hypothetical protein